MAKAKAKAKEATERTSEPIIQQQTDLLRHIFEQLEVVAVVFHRRTSQVVFMGPGAERALGMNPLSEQGGPVDVRDFIARDDLDAFNRVTSAKASTAERLASSKVLPVGA